MHDEEEKQGDRPNDDVATQKLFAHLIGTHMQPTLDSAQIMQNPSFKVALEAYEQNLFRELVRLCLFYQKNEGANAEIASSIHKKLNQYPCHSDQKNPEKQVVLKIMTIRNKILGLPDDEFEALTGLKSAARPDFSSTFVETLKEAREVAIQ